jgi:hypothetical protein
MSGAIGRDPAPPGFEEFPVRRTVLGSVVLATVAGSAFVGSPTASAAADTTAPRITLTAAPAGPVQLRADGFTAMTFRARVTDNVGVKHVGLGVDDLGSVYDILGFSMTRISGTARDGVWEMKLRADRAEPVGGWTVRLYAVDTAGNVSSDPMKVLDTFAMKYRSRVLEFNGSPESVAKGSTVTFTGRVQRVDALSGWTNAAGRTVALQFRKKGTSDFVTRKTLTTNADGTFVVKALAHAPGTWRAVYAGNASVARSVSGTDFIAVA